MVRTRVVWRWYSLIEPDIRQATILKRIVREQVRADLVAGRLARRSGRRDRRRVCPTSSCSPRCSRRATRRSSSRYLRTLGGAASRSNPHDSAARVDPAAAISESNGSGGGLFGKLLRRKDQDVDVDSRGCDPEPASPKRFEPSSTVPPNERTETVEVLAAAAAHTASSRQTWPPSCARRTPLSQAGRACRTDVTPGSAWASPFEWRRSTPGEAGRAASFPLVTNVPLAVLAEDSGTPGRRAERDARS